MKAKQPGDLFNEYQKLKKKKVGHEAGESKEYEAKEEEEAGEKDKKKKFWIQKAIKKPGALHKQLGIKAGKKIPAKTLAKAAKKGGKLGKRAQLAKTLKSFSKKKSEYAPVKLPKIKGDMAYKKGSKKKCK